jgi:hypothetical protein
MLTLGELGTTAGSATLVWQSGPSPFGPWTTFDQDDLSTHVTPLQSTWYRCIITCTSTGTSSAGQAVEVTVFHDPCECGDYASSYANENTGSDITEVSLAGITHTSVCATSPFTSFMQGRYTNYCGDVAAIPVLRNEEVELVVRGACSTTTHAYGVYIDWDQDGTFTGPDETVALGEFAALPGTASRSVLVPAQAPLGTTRMRVILNRVTNPALLLALGPYSMGETEDYCVDVQLPTEVNGTVPAAFRGLHVFPNPALDHLTIAGLPARATLQLFSPDGRLVRSARPTSDTHRLPVQDLATGTYLLLVEANGERAYRRVVVE